LTFNYIISIPNRQINESNIVDYFMYVFYVINDEKNANKIRKYYYDKLKEFKNIDINKKWFLLIFLRLKFISNKFNAKFIEQSIEYLINNISDIDIKDIERYIVMINESLSNLYNTSLAMRKSEMKYFKEITDYFPEHIKKIILNKDEIIKLFKDNIRRTDIFHFYLIIIKNEEKKYKNLTNFWDLYYDIMLNYAFINFDYIKESSDNFKNVILQFLDMSLIYNERTNKLKEKMKLLFKHKT